MYFALKHHVFKAKKYLRRVTQLKTQESKAHGDHSTAANVIPATIVTSPSKTRSRSVSPAKIPG